MKTGIKVTDAMTRSPSIADPDCTIYDCAMRMLNEHVGSLIVIKNRKLLGIVTERDILKRVLVKGVNIHKTKIKEVMTNDVTTISEDTDIYDAILFMSRYNTRRLPVIDENKNVKGLITQKDILKIQPDLYDILAEKFQIREIEDKPPTRNYIQGICQSCESYNTLYKTGKRWLCESCHKS